MVFKGIFLFVIGMVKDVLMILKIDREGRIKRGFVN